MKKVFLLATILGLVIFTAMAQDFTHFVNPMIGTDANGHVFPGASVPFGMIQVSPDQKTTGWEFCSGYRYKESTISGFSHTHLSGTGVGDLGDILIMPYIGRKSDTIPYPGKTTFSHLQEKSSPGYYQVYLPEPAINVELTASQRVGVHQYTFPQTNEAFININLKHKIYSNWGTAVETQFYIENDSTFSGYKFIAQGWAPARKVYFVIKTSKAAKNIFMNAKGWGGMNGLITRGVKSIKNNELFINLQFQTNASEKIITKVAISAVSLENARKNLDEVKDRDFDQVHEAAKELWNNYLTRIQIEGEPQVKEIFYTSLYHAMVQPNQIADPDSSYSGPDFLLHKSSTGKYYSTLSLWDTYRAAHPLYTILVPELVPGMINTMLQHESINGYLPIWTLWGTENHCMIGNHSIPVITDAIFKGFKGIDAEKAYSAIKKTLTQEHSNSHWNAWQYDKFGYVRADSCGESSVSKTLEYAYDDWCAAQLAKKLGKTKDYAYFMKRSQNYRNVFNPEKGFMWPRNTDGSWADWDEYRVQFGSPYTEGNAWQFVWGVQHDPYGLIGLFPSPLDCQNKLDSTFSNTHQISGHLNDVTGIIGQYAHGNEPGHHTAYLFQFLGQPWKTQKIIRQILETQYTNKADGLCGNEDCGQMSAWYALSALGFYPVNPANGVYVLGSPAVSKATIQVANGKTFVILAKNNSAKNIYVNSVILNGKPYPNTYIRHADIEKGGVLEFIMSDKPLMKVVPMGNRPPLE